MANEFVLILVMALSGTASIPTDRYGRALADERGLIDYDFDHGRWVAHYGDGSRSPIATPPGPKVEEPIAPPRSDLVPFYLGPPVALPTGSSPDAVAIGDVTGDGRNDVVIATLWDNDPPNDYQVFLFPQLANGTLDSPTHYPYGGLSGQNGIALTDLNEDGRLDVCVGYGSGLSILLADGAGGLNPAQLVAGDEAYTLAAMDVDRDGHQDLVSLSWTQRATIYFGDGTGAISHTQVIATNVGGYNDHEVEDLNNDGLSDLAVMSGEDITVPNLSVHLEDGTGFPDPPATYFVAVDLVTSGIGLGDVNDDCLHDVVLAGYGNRPVDLYLYHQTPAGGLSGPVHVPTWDIPEALETRDLNGDGLEDVVVAHGGFGVIGVYLQQPGGNGLRPEQAFDVPDASHYSPQGLAVGDFNADGCGDVAIANYNYGLVVLYGGACSTSCLRPMTIDAGPDRATCGTPVTLVGAVSSCAPAGLQYHWLAGTTEVCPWSAQSTCAVMPPVSTTYTVEVRGANSPRCTASDTVTTYVATGGIVNDLGNTLRAWKQTGLVAFAWSTDPSALTYNLHREQQPVLWTSPPLRQGLTSPSTTEPDLLGPPTIYFYRAAGVSCSGVPGPI